MKPARHNLPKKGGFTLIELITAMAIVSILMVGLVTIADRAAATWAQSESNIEKRRNTRAILDYITRDLSGAALPVGEIPTGTQSNLQFVLNPPDATLSAGIKNADALFWQTTGASDETSGEIAQVGYFVRYLSNDNGKPALKLCRYFVNPSDTANYKIYDQNGRFGWLAQSVIDEYTSAETRSSPSQDAADLYRGLMADNVIGLWIYCLDPLGRVISKSAAYTNASGQSIASTTYPGNSYDSNLGYQYRDQNGNEINVAPPALPASVEVAMVLLDSRGALRLTATDINAIRAGYNLVAAPDVDKPIDVSPFVNNLPESTRPSARVVRTKIFLNKS